MLKYITTVVLVIGLAACRNTSSNNNNNNNQSASAMTASVKDQRMDTAFFWKIMDSAFVIGRFDNNLRKQIIFDQLIKLTPQQIQDFEIIFQQMNLKASTFNNFAAQTIIEGGSSDDRFYYFRCWLISLGQKNFDETLKNPDYLASLDLPVNNKYNMPYCQFEELIPLADNAYEMVTKKDPTSDSTFPRPHAFKLGLFYDSGTKMTGKEWTDDDLPKIAPLLYKKYFRQS